MSLRQWQEVQTLLSAMIGAPIIRRHARKAFPAGPLCCASLEIVEVVLATDVSTGGQMSAERLLIVLALHRTRKRPNRE
jgi:hypothetical protein